ncbi:hypothetical protein RHO15_07065 [Utexia brackfieldae]|uniref:hypothetical protein n=1 Tax=Utexia brackfieldae TaxID=3074108 RepID=UPI00370D7600
MTSAGVAAGIDCCLHLLRTLSGSEAANRVAKRLVISPHRPGGQAQYIQQPVRPENNLDYFSQALNEVQSDLDRYHCLDGIAQKSLMAEVPSRGILSERPVLLLVNGFYKVAYH